MKEKFTKKSCNNCANNIEPMVCSLRPNTLVCNVPQFQYWKPKAPGNAQQQVYLTKIEEEKNENQ